jgi:hypothetical protein
MLSSSSDSPLGIIITLDNPIMVDYDDGSEYDGEHLHPNSQESLPPIVLTTIWDCPGIKLDEIVDADGKMIKGWRCGYCPIPGGLGAAPFFKYRNATKALSHLSSKGEDIVTCKGLKNVPANVRNALTALRHEKVNKKTNRTLQKNILIDEVIDNQEHILLSQQSNR